MSQHLAASKVRERSAERRTYAARYTLSESELMREIASAVRAESRRVNVSESEADALAQIAAERVLRNRAARRGPAREVLAFIDRAERFPLTAERREGIPRGEVGRNYLATIVRGVLTDRRDWRDVAETYQSARERQSASGPLVESLEAQSAGWLAQASARESEQNHAPRSAPLPEDLREVADALADAEENVSAAERESVRAALCAALPDALPGPALAVALGCSYGTLRNRVSAGNALLRKRYSASELVQLVRVAADTLALASGERSRVALGTAPELDALGTAALAATESVQAERKRSGAPRGAYSPATLRAARRNLRAERITGRWGTYSGTALAPLSGTAQRVWVGGPAESVPSAAERAERLAELVAEQRAALAAAEQRIAAAREVSGYSGR